MPQDGRAVQGVGPRRLNRRLGAVPDLLRRWQELASWRRSTCSWRPTSPATRPARSAPWPGACPSP